MKNLRFTFLLLLFLFSINLNVLLSQDTSYIKPYKPQVLSLYVDDISEDIWGSSTHTKFEIPDTALVNVIVLDSNRIDTVVCLFRGYLPRDIYVVYWNRKNSRDEDVESGFYLIIIDIMIKHHRRWIPEDYTEMQLTSEQYIRIF